ncbi:MAG: PRC-barrel domain-containing protein [Coriobacteriia bacterium]|nr:PRC-barrel domain-containing protein [Coriobacteriia bacterium]
MKTSAIRDVPVRSAGGSELGRVSEVLFHPSEPVAVGLSVQPPRVAGVVARAERYLPREACKIAEDAVVVEAERLPSRAASERAVGLAWDDTVQWRGMPVAAASGETIGSVADVEVDWATGSVIGVEVSTGIVGDVAVGRLSATAAQVVGFSEGAVRLCCEYAELAPSGGAAKAAAAGAAVLKDVGSAAAKRAYDAGMSAAKAVGRSMRSGAGNKVLRALKKAASELTREDG